MKFKNFQLNRKAIKLSERGFIPLSIPQCVCFPSCKMDIILTVRSVMLFKVQFRSPEARPIIVRVNSIKAKKEVSVYHVMGLRAGETNEKRDGKEITLAPTTIDNKNYLD